MSEQIENLVKEVYAKLAAIAESRGMSKQVLGEEMGHLRTIIRQSVENAKENKHLLNCSAESIKNAVSTAWQNALTLNPYFKMAYIIPYGNEAKFEPSYMGLIHSLQHFGLLKKVFVELIHENDAWTYEPSAEQKITHRVLHFDTEQRGKMIAAYGVFELPDGTKQYPVYSAKEIEAAKSASKGKGSGYSPYQNFEIDMVKKIVVRKAVKFIPKSGNVYSLPVFEEFDDQFANLAPAKKSGFAVLKEAAKQIPMQQEMQIEYQTLKKEANEEGVLGNSPAGLFDAND